MTRVSDLSQDLIEEILSRVPLTSHRAVRSTCKHWNGLDRDESFAKKHCGKAANGNTMVIMVRDSSVCLVSFDLQGFHKQKDGLVGLSKKSVGQCSHITVSKVYYCDGLLLGLCLPRNSRVNPDLVVMNPYLGQLRWIKPRKEKLDILDRYCMGYDNKKKHKILRFLHHDNGTVEHEIYDFKYDSWRVLDVPPDWYIPHYSQGGLSLKGNTYFVAQRSKDVEMRQSLICFDFTSEGFRHCLDLESNYRSGDYTVVLSAVREEELAVLYHRVDTHEIEIRITTNIEAKEVSWRSFLKVDLKLIPGTSLRVLGYGRFLVDENKEVALVWDKYLNNAAYVIGKDNYFKIVYLEASTRRSLVCSYVPSSVQIRKRKLRDC